MICECCSSSRQNYRKDVALLKRKRSAQAKRDREVVALEGAKNDQDEDGGKEREAFDDENPEIKKAIKLRE